MTIKSILKKAKSALFGKELKQAIVVRSDLKMPKGKIAVQAAHASVEAVLLSDSNLVNAWRKQGMKKAVLKAESLQELVGLKKEAKKQGLVCAVIKDAGKTVLKPGTITAIAIGPDYSDKIDVVSGRLKML